MMMVCVLHKDVLESFGVLQFVKLEKENKLNKFLLIFLVYRIIKENFNKF